MNDCPNCLRPIHSLDGAVSHLGKPFEHFSCEEAARIDYGAAFDRIYAMVQDAADRTWSLIEDTAGDEAFQERYDKSLIGVQSLLGDAVSWATYEAERKVAA